jgi:hypothetical protein
VFGKVPPTSTRRKKNNPIERREKLRHVVAALLIEGMPTSLIGFNYLAA